MKNNTISLNDLEKGVKRLLRKNRCSFSSNEIDTLLSCLELIKQAKSNKQSDSILKILSVLSRVFIIGSSLLDDH